MSIRQLLVAGSCVVAMTLPAGLAAAVDMGTMTRAETLRSKPFADAAAVVQATSGAKVEIVTRNGGWYQVKTAGKTGWVRMLSVRRTAAATGSSVAGIAGVVSGRTGTGKVTTTTGVRGLEAEELKTAAFNAEQIAKVEQYRVSRKDADAFAQQAKLTPRDVKPLPAPAKK